MEFESSPQQWMNIEESLENQDNFYCSNVVPITELEQSSSQISLFPDDLLSSPQLTFESSGSDCSPFSSSPYQSPSPEISLQNQLEMEFCKEFADPNQLLDLFPNIDSLGVNPQDIITNSDSMNKSTTKEKKKYCKKRQRRDGRF
jgi:hypothetical protein